MNLQQMSHCTAQELLNERALIMPSGVDENLARRCSQVADSILAVYGELDAHCWSATQALVMLLQHDGYQARMSTGVTGECINYTNSGNLQMKWAYHHWASCGAYRLDPTVTQFSGREDHSRVSLLSATAPLYEPIPSSAEYDPYSDMSADERMDTLIRSLDAETKQNGWDADLAEEWLNAIEALFEDALVLI